MTAREVSPHPCDVAGLERAWNDALDKLENMNKSRIS